MHKLSQLVDDEWREHSYAARFSVQSAGGTPQLIVGVPAGEAMIFERLVLSLAEPYVLLYVLHTPRGEGDEGRYESPKLSATQFRSFMEKYGAYLSSDARFDVWAFSVPERSTLVWDRHNLVYGYGPIDRFVSVLRSLGFVEGASDVPVPHSHHYRAEWDAHAAGVLSEFPWSHSALRPEDEQ